MDIKKTVEAEESFLISLRRHFHENPELSQQEFQTMDFIEETLHGWGDFHRPRTARRCLWHD